jgi:hypothetical protein
MGIATEKKERLIIEEDLEANKSISSDLGFDSDPIIPSRKNKKSLSKSLFFKKKSQNIGSD